MSAHSVPPPVAPTDRPSRLIWLSLALFLAVYGPSVAYLIDRWGAGVWFQSHGIIVPFLVAYLVRAELKRPEMAARGREASALGFAFLVPALLLHVLDTCLRSQILSAASIVPAVIGLCLLVLGWPRTRAILFPLAFLAFMVPLPFAVIQPVQDVLRRLSAVGTGGALSVCGVAHIRDQTTITMVQGSVQIADACSGFSTVSATVAFAAFMIYLRRSPVLPSLAFAAIAAPVGLFANVLRCTALAIAVNLFGSQILETFWHELSGYVAYGIGIGLLLAASPLIERRSAPAC